MPKAAQKPSDLNIDLLPNESPINSSNTAVHWSLTVGRYLIIATEVLALTIFLFGVWLSKEKNDLKNSIKYKQASVDQLQKCDQNKPDEFCEDRFRKVQDQINQTALIRNSQFEQNKVLTEFAHLLPIGLTLDSITSDGKLITFSGTFPDPQQLQTMINSFNSSKKITNLDITALSKESDVSYKFSASTTINKAAFASN